CHPPSTLFGVDAWPHAPRHVPLPRADRSAAPVELVWATGIIPMKIVGYLPPASATSSHAPGFYRAAVRRVWIRESLGSRAWPRNKRFVRAYPGRRAPIRPELW